MFIGIKTEIVNLGVFYSIAGIIFAVVFILTVNLFCFLRLPQDGLRYEGLFSSTPIMALAVYQQHLFFIKIIRIIGVFGIIIAFSV